MVFWFVRRFPAKMVLEYGKDMPKNLELGPFHFQQHVCKHTTTFQFPFVEFDLLDFVLLSFILIFNFPFYI